MSGLGVVDALIILVCNAMFFASGWLFGVKMTHDYYAKKKEPTP